MTVNIPDLSELDKIRFMESERVAHRAAVILCSEEIQPNESAVTWQKILRFVIYSCNVRRGQVMKLVKQYQPIELRPFNPVFGHFQIDLPCKKTTLMQHIWAGKRWNSSLASCRGHQLRIRSLTLITESYNVIQCHI